MIKKLLFVAVALAMVLSSVVSVLVAPGQSPQRVEADEYTTILTPIVEPMPILANELIPTYLHGMQNSIYDDDIVINESTTWSAGTYEYDNILITSDSVLTLQGSVTINCAHLTVESGSRVSADGTGYGSGTGSGAGSTCGDDPREYYCQYSGGGGGYGSNGGSYSCAGGGDTYGSLYEPIDLGSGGGDGGGAGGGALKLHVYGTLLNDGMITANGNDGEIHDYKHHGGGGSGGSIYIITNTLAGDGFIAANGGSSSYAGGGAGGRIAIYCNSNSFSSNITAYGGSSSQAGGAGTVFTKSAAQTYGKLIIDNNNYAGTITHFVDGIYNFNSVTVSGGASLEISSNITINAPELVEISNSGTLYVNAPITVHDMTIRSGGVVTHFPGNTNCSLTANGNLTIDAGAAINLDGKGFGSDAGPGAGRSNEHYGSGAGYGGNGVGNAYAGAGGFAYGSVSEPVDLGSGGGMAWGCGGGAGGGALKLTVYGNLSVNGVITANGNGDGSHSGNYYASGGGSGGSIYITTCTLAGNGSITANGGSASVSAGGGAGGRIAIYFNNNSFSNNITAYGGSSSQAGGAGTVFTKSFSQPYGNLLIDNKGNIGVITPWLNCNDTFGNITVAAGATLDISSNITINAPELVEISNSGTLYVNAPITVHDMIIRLGGVVTHSPGNANCSLTANGNLTIDAGAAINLDGKGFGSDAGPGAGRSNEHYGSGAGYGGNGGGNAYAGAGGFAYGSIAEPVDLGSGGGMAWGCGGGAGGGALKLTVYGNLSVNGVITANGNGDGSHSGNYYASGGGSGGSIYITTCTLAGNGSITANGGSASFSAGGGAGGRIAIYSNSRPFYGDITVTGSYGGGEGTVFNGSFDCTPPTPTPSPTPAATPWSFAIITDTHVGGSECQDGGDYDFGATGWDDYYDYTSSNSEGALLNLRTSVARINDIVQRGGNPDNIKFIVILGDLTHSAELSELQAAKDALSELKIPWLPIIGSHDVWPYTGTCWATGSHCWGTEFVEPQAEEEGPDWYFDNMFDSDYQNFSDDLELPSTWKEPARVLNTELSPDYYSYFQNMEFDYGGFHFIAADFNDRHDADEQLIGGPMKGTTGEPNLWEFEGGTWYWFKQHLTTYLSNSDNQAQGKNIIILSHNPFAAPFPADQWHYVNWDIDETTKISHFLITYKENLNIQFSGHLHPGEYFGKRGPMDATLVYHNYFTHKAVMSCITIPNNGPAPWVQIVKLNPSDKSVKYDKALFHAITYKTDCPVNLIINDPDNLVISKDINQIPGAFYSEYDRNGDGSPDDLIWIPDRKPGNYSIQVIPESSANASDTFTLTASPTEDKWGETPIILAQNVTISNIPTEPYTFEVKQRTATNLSYTGSLCSYNFDTINLTAALSTDNGSPLSGKTINFLIGNQSVSSMTDSNGVATVSLTLNQTPSQYYYVEYGFAGDRDYLPYYDSVPFEIINIPPVADIGGPYISYEGSPITFNGSGSYDADGTIVDYSWDFGDGSPAVNGTATPAHTYTSAGTYTVTLNVTDDTGAVGTDTATVEVAANIYTLTTSSTDGGNVTAPREGTNTYNCGQIVNLVATPDSCYHFVNWTGDTINIADVNASSTTIVMNGSYSITANFAIDTYTLTYTTGAHGSINGSTTQTIDCCTNGSAVIAVPDACYHFVNWSDSIATASRTDTNVTANTTVTANFAINIYTLNTSATNGSVLTPGQPIPFTYNCSQVVSIQAMPANASCKFVNWTGDTGTIANVSANSTTITMNGNYSVQANFVVTGPTTTTYTFATGGGVNKWCWEGHVHLIDWNNGHPSSPSDLANSYGYAAGGSSAYSAVNSSDSSSWRSNISHDLGCCAFDRNCELFKFKINESPASITNIQIKWKGHGTTGETIYSTTKKLWKASNNTWNTIKDQTNITSDTIWTNNVSSSCSSYIDSTGNLSILFAAQRSGLPNNCGIWTNYIEVTITHN